MDEVDFTILAAKSVFTDMIDKCPPAEACRDAFDRTVRATVKMANVNGGFGAHARRRPKSSGPPRDGTAMDWQSSTGSPSNTSLSNQAGRPLGLEVESLSSPAMSADKESPLVPRKHEDGYGVAQAQDVSPIDPALLATPALGSGAPQQQQPRGYLPQQDAFQAGAEYPDLQSMEFLQALQGSAPSGDLGSLDPLGFGLSWDAGLNQDLDGQQVNPFDGFFFGGQGQGGQGQGGQGQGSQGGGA